VVSTFAGMAVFPSLKRPSVRVPPTSISTVYMLSASRPSAKISDERVVYRTLRGLTLMEMPVAKAERVDTSFRYGTMEIRSNVLSSDNRIVLRNPVDVK
jgi:hypothetical protein